MSETVYTPGAVERLLAAPTAAGWEREILHLVEGNREKDLQGLGSAEQYVKVLLRESNNRAEAKASFRQALRTVVQEWHPESETSERRMSAMLSLIGAYTPAIGFVKILGHIDSWGRFGSGYKTRPGSVDPADIHMQALGALRNYYPAPPPTAEILDLGFSSYRRVLEEHLSDPQYVGYATRRLIELDIIKLDDNKLSGLLTENLEILRELVPLLVQENRIDKASQNFGHLYVQCRSIGDAAVDALREAIEAEGGRLDVQQNVAPDLYLDTGEAVRLNLSPEDIGQHALERYEDTFAADLKRLLPYIHESAKARAELADIIIQLLPLKSAGLNKLKRQLAVMGAKLDPVATAAGPVIVNMKTNEKTPIPIPELVWPEYIITDYFEEWQHTGSITDATSRFMRQSTLEWDKHFNAPPKSSARGAQPGRGN
ncbi:MAG TPA: hypothetical protein VF754_08790 [Pyrinomonadaceae bacterium]